MIEFNVNRKPPKVRGAHQRDCKSLLENAKRTKQKIAALTATDPEKAKELAEKQRWAKAMLRAKGHKIQDDVKTLKKAVRLKERKKEKAKKDWRKRYSKVAKLKRERQAKREENLKNRRSSKRRT